MGRNFERFFILQPYYLFFSLGRVAKQRLEMFIARKYKGCSDSPAFFPLVLHIQDLYYILFSIIHWLYLFC